MRTILGKLAVCLTISLLFASCHTSGGSSDEEAPAPANEKSLEGEMFRLYPKFMEACTKYENNSKEVQTTLKAVGGDSECYITANQLSQSSELSLPNKNISDISVLYEFKSIKSIDLSGNKEFKDIDGLIKNMDQVQTLQIKDSGIPPKEIEKVKEKAKGLSIDFTPFYDERGFDVEGNHKITGTEFGPDHLTQSGSRFGSNNKTWDNSKYYDGFDYLGYDIKGFDTNGIHKETQTEFNKNHLTKSGSRFGSNHMTWDNSKYYDSFDYLGYDIKGFNAKGIHKETSTEFDENHLTRSGSRFGSNNKAWDNSDFYQGYNVNGLDVNGFNRSGIHNVTNSEFGPDHLTQTRSRFGSNHLTYNNEQYYENYDYLGFNILGFNRSGTHRNTTNRDDAGYDVRGFLANGTHRNGRLYDDHGQNMAGQTRSEAEEFQIGKACYIPGANDYMGRDNQRDLKNFPAIAVTEVPETIDLTQFNNIDEFITGIHNKCREYNASVRSNAGESITQTRVRLFDGLRTNLINIAHGGMNRFHGTKNLVDIRRDRIVAEYLNTIKPAHFFKDTRVSFHGESGIDAGGLRKELFRNIVDKFKQEGVFSKISDGSKVWELNPDFANYNFCTRPDQARNKQTCFENVGKVIAKILMVEKDYIEIPFSNYLLQKMLDNTPLSLVDYFSLAKLDDSHELFKNQIATLTYDDPSFFYLTFAGHNGVGAVDYVTNGQNVDVVAGNIYLFTLLDLKYKIATRRSEVNQYFLNGFHSVINPIVLQASGTNANELELILRGIPEIKADHIQPIARTQGNATLPERERIVRWFWEIVREIEATDESFVPQLMIFWTSSRTIPTDIGRQPMEFSVQSGRSIGRLPTSHTCFNTLDLSVYPSKEILKQKLIQAVRLSQGFDE